MYKISADRRAIISIVAALVVLGFGSGSSQQRMDRLKASLLTPSAELVRISTRSLSARISPVLTLTAASASKIGRSTFETYERLLQIATHLTLTLTLI